MIATKNEILDYINSIDIVELVDRMELYVHSRFFNKDCDIRNNFEYVDFCYEVLHRACDGSRNWNKKEFSFEEFVFGVLKSILYAHFKKMKSKKNEIPIIKDIEDYINIEIQEIVNIESKIDFEDISNDSIQDLKNQGADELELSIFECWLEGYFKRAEIATLCDVGEAKLNSAYRRLFRKTIKIRGKWMILKD